MSDVISGGLVILLILIGIFLLFREFWCWYWKINERIALLKKIESHLSVAKPAKKTEKKVEIIQNQETVKSESDHSFCEICGFKNMVTETNCLKCGAPL